MVISRAALDAAFASPVEDSVSHSLPRRVVISAPVAVVTAAVLLPNTASAAPEPGPSSDSPAPECAADLFESA